MRGQFPALRKVLEAKSVPDRYYGPTSVSDTVFDRVHCLMTMAILVHENRGELAAALKVETPDRESHQQLFMLRSDRERLHDAFCWGSNLFEAAVSDLESGLGVTPENERAQDIRKRRHGIFSLALIVSFYCEKFGDLPDVAGGSEFMLMLFGRPSHSEKAKNLRSKAREWMEKYGLKEEPPAQFERVWPSYWR
jgi:hypothetical protein